MKRKKKEPPFRTYVSKICKELRWLFFANAYTMHICWKDDEYIRTSDTHEVAAQILIDNSYLTFDVIIYKTLLESYEAKKYDEVLQTLIHEFCHLLTEPLYRFALEHCPKETEPHLLEVRERQTELIRCVIASWNTDRIPKK